MHGALLIMLGIFLIAIGGIYKSIARMYEKECEHSNDDYKLQITFAINYAFYILAVVYGIIVTLLGIFYNTSFVKGI